MKKVIVVLVLFSACTSFLMAEEKNEKRWEEIDQRLEKAITTETQEARKAYLNYVGSLSGRELLTASRFGARRISEDEGPALTREALVRLSCFAKYYPRKLYRYRYHRLRHPSQRHRNLYFPRSPPQHCGRKPAGTQKYNLRQPFKRNLYY